MTIPNYDNGLTDCGVVDLIDDGWLSGCGAGPDDNAGPGDDDLRDQGNAPAMGAVALRDQGILRDQGLRD